MSLSVRVLAAVCILILATVGCQQGKQPGATGDEAKAESGGAGSKGSKARAKTGVAAKRSSGTATAGSDAGAGGSRAAGRLTAADDGRDFDLRQGQVLTVVLDSNRPSGLKWVMVDPVGAVIVRDGSPVYAAKSGGSGGSETWRFRAARPGMQTVRLEYRRQWQQVPERTFRFSVTVR